MPARAGAPGEDSQRKWRVSRLGDSHSQSAHQAVEAIREALRMGKTEVVDADLAQYFDTIPHCKLMRQVARRVSDGAILKLIKAWLRAPIVEEEEGGGRRIKANPCGTPQGGVISPLLANLYLHSLDEGGSRLGQRLYCPQDSRAWADGCKASSPDDPGLRIS